MDEWYKQVGPANFTINVAEVANMVRLNIASLNGNFFFFLPKEIAKQVGQAMIHHASGLIMPDSRIQNDLEVPSSE